jgi:outer membrane immunogenic protein
MHGIEQKETAMRELYVAVPAGIILMITGSATAADLGLQPAYNAPAAVARSWSGPYAGLFAGYGWGTPDATEPVNAATGFFYNVGSAPYSLDADGFFGGGTLGYNWQPGALVLGLEGEVGYLGLEGSRIDPNGIVRGTPDTTTRFNSDFYSAVTGRLGLPMNNILLYAEGGGALLDAKATTIDPCIAPPVGCGIGTLSMRGDKTMFGWTAGGGIEWAYAANWTAKVEYAYFDFGEIDLAGASTFTADERQSIDVTAQTVRVGVNYRWGAP